MKINRAATARERCHERWVHTVALRSLAVAAGKRTSETGTVICDTIER